MPAVARLAQPQPTHSWPNSRRYLSQPEPTSTCGCNVVLLPARPVPPLELRQASPQQSKAESTKRGSCSGTARCPSMNAYSWRVESDLVRGTIAATASAGMSSELLVESFGSNLDSWVDRGLLHPLEPSLPCVMSAGCSRTVGSYMLLLLLLLFYF